MPRARVRLVPGTLPVSRQACAVVVDVLRATTTLAFARANGARAVLPAATPDEAWALHARMPGSLLCGERDGRIVPGFDLGNSPAEYTAERVRGRTLIFASTNGSMALLRAQSARRRVPAGFVNASAVTAAVAREREIEIVCSGQFSAPSLEDAAFAGWMCRMLAARGVRIEGADAGLAIGLAPDDEASVLALLESCSHGRYLRHLGPGFRRDVELCARVDVLDRAEDV